MALGTGGRTITKVGADLITDGTITASKFAATGTASSTTVLKGNMTWGSGSPSGKRDFTDTNAAPTAGDVWFESSTLKFAINPNAASGVWQKGGNMTRDSEQAPVAGTLQAAILAGGENSGYKTQTDLYNGELWSTSGATLTTARANSPLVGSSSACIYCGGQGSGTLDTCEEFDMTTWSAGGALDDDYTSGVGEGFGILSAVVLAGGSRSGSTSAVTQLYNGTTWSLGNSLLATRNYAATAGKDSAGLVTGGTGNLTTTEEYDGTSWTAGGALTTGRAQLAGAGSQNAALCFGGSTGSNSVVAEEYDGSSWSATGSLVTARRSAGGNGSQSRAVVTSGYGSTYMDSTEEYWKLEFKWEVGS